MSFKQINEPSDLIKAQYERWKTNRDALAGVYTIKPAGELYLPRPSDDTSENEYRSLVKYTNWYPATTRVAQGVQGLLMRKPPALVGDGRLKEVKNVITKDGRTIGELARDCVWETAATGFGGLWVDVPVGSARNAKEQKDRGLLPYLSLYSAENILAVESAEVAFKKVLGRVVMRDDDKTIREAYLNDAGNVEVILHTTSDGYLYRAGPAIPMIINRKPLREIPFVLLSDKDTFTPQPALLDHVADLNIQHYRVCGLIAHFLMFTSMPMMMATGIEEGQEKTIKMGPGRIVTFPELQSKFEYVVLSGDNLPGMERERDNIADQMAIVGARILEPQKTIAEAAETEAMRQGAENASLATFANAISSRMEKALQIVSDWMGYATPVQFQINTDYLPLKMTTAEATLLKDLRERNDISRRTLHLILRDRGVLNENHTTEEEEQWLAAERALGVVAQPTPTDD